MILMSKKKGNMKALLAGVGIGAGLGLLLKREVNYVRI